MILIAPVSAQVHITASGCVDQPNSQVFETKISLFDVLSSIEYTNCYYGLGASWLQKGLLPSQKMKKKRLLELIEWHLGKVEEASAIEYLSDLRDLIESQKTTGRVIPADLDLFHVEMLPLKNRIITADSEFYFPAQPAVINLVGFKDTTLTYDSDLSITDIYQSNDICDACQHGWLWLVQPDGSVEKRKVGLWTNEEFYLAPGGWLISPLNVFDQDENNEFYRLLTAWLATQVIVNEK